MKSLIWVYSTIRPDYDGPKIPGLVIDYGKKVMFNDELSKFNSSLISLLFEKFFLIQKIILKIVMLYL